MTNFNFSDIKVKIYYDSTRTYYGDAVTDDIINRLSFIEVDTSIPPENYFVLNGSVHIKPSLSAYEAAITMRLNMTAIDNGYDNAHSFALRAAYPGPYQAEGIAFAQWMDECWYILYNHSSIPPLDDFLASLPALNLP